MIKNKLLIVVDMQNDFCFGALANPMAVSVIPQIVDEIKAYKSEGNKVVFTRDTHAENYMETEEGKNLPVPHCIKGTKGWELVDYIKELVTDEDEVFDKVTFGSDGLYNYLDNYGSSFDEIELVGVCTDICVISNAVLAKTACPNAHIVIDAGCCAGVTVESHETALNAMKALQMEVKREGDEIWRHIDLSKLAKE